MNQDTQDKDAETSNNQLQDPQNLGQENKEQIVTDSNNPSLDKGVQDSQKVNSADDLEEKVVNQKDEPINIKIPYYKNTKYLVISGGVFLILLILSIGGWILFVKKTDDAANNVANDVVETDQFNEINDKDISSEGVEPLDDNSSKNIIDKSLSEEIKESKRQGNLVQDKTNEVKNVEFPDQMERAPIQTVDDDHFFTQELRKRYQHIGSKTPKICLIVQNLGLNQELTEQAIKDLPPSVSLAFNPYTVKIEKHIRQARLSRHELLLSVPMETYEYPNNDTGDLTLLTGLDSQINLSLLKSLLDKFLGIQGVIAMGGDLFLHSSNDLHPILQEIQKQNLVFIDSGRAIYSSVKHNCDELNMRCLAVDRQVFNSNSNIAQLNILLQNLENLAFETGYAIGVVDLSAESLERIKTWLATLESKKITMVSAISLIDVKKK